MIPINHQTLYPNWKTSLNVANPFISATFSHAVSQRWQRKWRPAQNLEAGQLVSLCSLSNIYPTVFIDILDFPSTLHLFLLPVVFSWQPPLKMCAWLTERRLNNQHGRMTGSYIFSSIAEGGHGTERLRKGQVTIAKEPAPRRSYSRHRVWHRVLYACWSTNHKQEH